MLNQMKKHLTLIIVIFLAFECTSQAQARFGILVGPQSASVFESNSVPGWFNVKDFYSSRFSLHGGVTLDVPFSAKSPVHFQPALLFGHFEEFRFRSDRMHARHGDFYRLQFDT